MSDGKWSGSWLTMSWSRPGVRYSKRDPQADAALSASMHQVEFWCETCGRMHQLIEHRECRASL